MNQNWLTRALEESRARGFLGPGDFAPHIVQAELFLSAWLEMSHTPPSRWMDMGSGGGIPGLVLATTWQQGGILADAMIKRTRFLDEVRLWDDAPSYEVVTGRMEELAREAELEESCDVVVARLFGPPAVTAECAVRFIKPGGVLLVSEPPDSDGSRWNTDGLSQLGLSVRLSTYELGKVAIFTKDEPTPPRFPRPNGAPGRKPLWR
jgi:16S rRNA (guanine527-N7)-methyltransferase